MSQKVVHQGTAVIEEQAAGPCAMCGGRRVVRIFIGQGHPEMARVHAAELHAKDDDIEFNVAPVVVEEWK